MGIAYITKYALTKGILEVNVEAADEWMAIKVISGVLCGRVYNEKYWEIDIEVAFKIAEEMRTKKIKQLEYRIALLSKSSTTNCNENIHFEEIELLKNEIDKLKALKINTISE